MTLWSGRIQSSMNQTLWDLSESYSFDHVLYAYDLAGTRAHVRGLVHADLLSADEGVILLAALDTIESEFETDAFITVASDEDVHTAIERRATELAGSVGAKIHTARSRNDQVSTALRLFTRDALTEIASSALDLAAVLSDVGSRYSGAYLPGYTHLQRAQPVLLAHHLEAHALALVRDADRLFDARTRLNVSPLGAGALAGSSLAIDPSYTAELLDFDSAFVNSMDAVSDRDFVVESLFDIALLGVHLSRMGEELVLWTTSEFSFATLGDEFTTGSSMLPQKKNSDVAELARGKSGRLIGNLTGLLATLKGLPLSYNRDLQEDKEPLFDSVRQVLLVLRALAGAYASMQFHTEIAQLAADDEFLVAVDLAEELVSEGVPFREAHEEVGILVAQAVATKQSLREVIQHSHLHRLEHVFTKGAGVARRRSPGASGPDARVGASARFQSLLDAARSRV